MDVMLKPELERFVAEKMRTGQYSGPSEVVNAALEALKDQEEFTPEQEVYLQREVKRGIEQLDQGQYTDFSAETIIAQERRRLAGGKGS
jgi:putative addiction module CopG family antidote